MLSFKDIRMWEFKSWRIKHLVSVGRCGHFWSWGWKSPPSWLHVFRQRCSAAHWCADAVLWPFTNAGIYQAVHILRKGLHWKCWILTNEAFAAKQLLCPVVSHRNLTWAFHHQAVCLSPAWESWWEFEPFPASEMLELIVEFWFSLCTKCTDLEVLLLKQNSTFHCMIWIMLNQWTVQYFMFHPDCDTVHKALYQGWFVSLTVGFWEVVKWKSYCWKSCWNVTLLHLDGSLLIYHLVCWIDLSKAQRPRSGVATCSGSLSFWHLFGGELLLVLCSVVL